MAKGLTHFENFDAERYFKGKTLVAMVSEDWKDFNTQEIIGSKYSVVIWEDKTEYAKEGISNVGETHIIKVKDRNPKPITSPTNIVLINPQGKVYGDFRNELSVTADDVKLLNSNNKQS